MIERAYRAVVTTTTVVLPLAVGGCTNITGGMTTQAVITKQPVPGTAVTLEFVELPRGETVAAFSMSRTEITWDLYDVFVYGLDESSDAPGTPGTPDAPATPDAVARPSKPYISMDRGFGHRGYPAISMSAAGAEAFCRWLTLKTGVVYRLPSVAEWTHACRLGGVDAETLDDHAWHKDNARRRTHPVARKKPDATGLYDLHGNASEWCIGSDGKPVTMGGTYRDRVGTLGCGSMVKPVKEWNASDPQIPKSIWWLADGGFVGLRVVTTLAKQPEATEKQGEAGREQPTPRETSR